MDISIETESASFFRPEHQSWLVVDGVRVAWADYHLEDGVPMLHTIETRPGYRQQGFATRLLTEIARAHGVESVHHDAGFTPEGLRYLSGKVSRPEHAGAAKVDFRSMDFICDWEHGYKHDDQCGH